ncbi:MAG: signal peptidase I [Spirochaetes bacterium]|nr:signal peptidase I [Spirochaetota bacterium]
MKRITTKDLTLLSKIIILFAGIIIGFICIRIFFLLMTIKSDSMNPTLKAGDKIVINKMSGIKKGDIAAIESPTERNNILILRIIASEHETVEIRNKEVFINDKRIDIIADSTRDKKNIYPMKFCYRDNMPPLQLDRNEYFVLGDNFDKSYDSRIFGKIQKNIIIGKVIYHSGK